MSTYSEPILLVHGLEKEIRFARAMGYPATVASGSGHIEGRRLIEYAAFNDPSDGRVAVLIECGQHWAKTTADVAVDSILHYLTALDMIDPGFVTGHQRTAKPERQSVLEVTDGYAIRTDDFHFIRNYKGLERFETAGEVFAVDGGEEIRLSLIHI